MQGKICIFPSASVHKSEIMKKCTTHDPFSCKTAQTPALFNLNSNIHIPS